MPILKNAKKALRSSQRKTVINNKVRSKLKTMVDGFKKSPTVATLSLAFSAIDKAKKRNLIEPNKAARVKSQLTKLVPTK
jgi:small subunit ribosomal protein S20